MNKKIIIIFSTLFIITVGLCAGILWLTWSGEPREVTAEINKFNTPSDWKLVKETIYPKRHACLGDQPCDAIIRIWETEEKIMSKDKINSLIISSGLPLRITRDCSINKKFDSMQIPICHTHKNTIKNYYSISYYKETQKNMFSTYIESQ